MASIVIGETGMNSPRIAQSHPTNIPQLRDVCHAHPVNNEEARFVEDADRSFDLQHLKKLSATSTTSRLCAKSIST
ncbi:hypothetical protein [Synechococcus sp. PROS-7-1]|uniref:hypothetical protein n=1 Tax=Synechococcus sp. PROS-7-1 TaxID=1442556 RepID=UPI001647B4C4|nr:hypothetical protein [Synechococcus sp. PROS-7-1]